MNKTIGILTKLVLIQVLITLSLLGKGQYTDSLTADHIIPGRKSNNNNPVLAHAATPLNYHSFVIPLFMTFYGFTTIGNHLLQDLNQEFKEEFWIEHPHKKWTADNFMQFTPAAAVYGLNMAGIKGKSNLKDRSIIYLISNVMLNVTVSSLKNSMNQRRPDGSSYRSFPSGHTAEAFASAEFLRQEYKDRSPWYGVAGYTIATATGVLRMYNNKHWLSDVVAGAGIGMACTKLAYWIYPAAKRIFAGKPYHRNEVVVYL